MLSRPCPVTAKHTEKISDGTLFLFFLFYSIYLFIIYFQYGKKRKAVSDHVLPRKTEGYPLGRDSPQETYTQFPLAWVHFQGLQRTIL